MNRFQIHYNKIIKYDLLNQYLYKNIFTIPKITEITLILSSPKLIFKKKLLLNYLIFLEIITGLQGQVIKSKKNKIQLKIKKGDIVGCKVKLTKNKIYHFLEVLTIFILPNIKNEINLKFNKNCINIIDFIIPNILKFPNLENETFRFPSFPPLKIIIKTNSTSILKTKLLLQSFNLPLKK